MRNGFADHVSVNLFSDKGMEEDKLGIDVARTSVSGASTLAGVLVFCRHSLFPSPPEGEQESLAQTPRPQRRELAILRGRPRRMAAGELEDTTTASISRPAISGMVKGG
jgi:hypothetical protein